MAQRLSLPLPPVLNFFARPPSFGPAAPSFSENRTFSPSLLLSRPISVSLCLKSLTSGVYTLDVIFLSALGVVVCVLYFRDNPP